jgi:hypothetical protein
LHELRNQLAPSPVTMDGGRTLECAIHPAVPDWRVRKSCTVVVKFASRAIERMVGDDIARTLCDDGGEAREDDELA